MFNDDFKDVVSQEILIAAKLLKAGSPQGYEYLRSMLGHALFFAHDDKAIFYLQHILGPMRQEVILAVAQDDKTILTEIGKKLEIIGKMLAEGKDNEILELTTEIGLLIEKAWRKVIQSPKGPIVSAPILKFG
ncbi:hypothetical protein ig2599ANME_0633 [groundwater metagenome]